MTTNVRLFLLWLNCAHPIAFYNLLAVIDVSCAPANVFSGDDQHRDSVQVTLSNFLDMVWQANNGGDHFLMGLGMEYYLCQIPIMSADLSAPPLLHELQADIQMYVI